MDLWCFSEWSVHGRREVDVVAVAGCVGALVCGRSRFGRIARFVWVQLVVGAWWPLVVVDGAASAVGFASVHLCVALVVRVFVFSFSEGVGGWT